MGVEPVPNNRPVGTESEKKETSVVSLPEDLSFSSVMKKKLMIAPENKSAWLDIVRKSDQAEAVELLLGISKIAPDQQSYMRWAGGCKGFDQETVEKLFAFVAKGNVSQDGKRFFQGSVGSGGTMDLKDDGSESVMICQIPYYLGRLMPCATWGSTPQTFRARIDEKNGVIVSKYGASLDPRGHMNVLTQDSVSGFQAWDGDVRWYVSALESFAKRGFHVAVGVVNGGDVTLDEALLSLSKGIPVIVVEGSGRAADDLVKAYQSETVAELYDAAFQRSVLNPDQDRVPSESEIQRLLNIVHINDSAALSDTMDKLGLLSELPKLPRLAA